jgi:hypothetical protein
MTPEEQKLMLQQLLAAKGQSIAPPEPAPMPVNAAMQAAPIGPIGDAASQADDLGLKRLLLQKTLGGGQVGGPMAPGGGAEEAGFIQRLMSLFGGGGAPAGAPPQ